MKQFNQRIIPSELRYKSAPSVDQEVDIIFEQNSKVNIEYDRIATVSLQQVYEDERQSCEIFRPTFQINYVYDNRYIGTTNYAPFRDNLFYVSAETSSLSNVWYGYPQFYEFDFFRPNVNDQHIVYQSKSGFSYNWSFYITYPHNNDYEKKLNCDLNGVSFPGWVAKDGIPFKINKIQINGDKLISFECPMSHGLQVAESVELSFGYNNTKIFEVYSLGNTKVDSEQTVFNIFDVGYTGTTFSTNRVGTFKRIINTDSIEETRSKYYVREHKVLLSNDDLIITKTGFQKNSFYEEKQITLSSLTPNRITRVSKKNNTDSYTITTRKDLDLSFLYNNKKQPITEIFLTVINKGYSGYFNKPTVNNISLKEGWFFNITENTNFWWADTNFNSNTNISTNSYTKTDYNGVTKSFYYNETLTTGETMYGDFCEWNDYEQKERVISEYYHKLKYNQDNFQIEISPSQNAPGFYYKPHNKMTLRVFSDYIETGDLSNVDNVPFYSFYSNSNKEFIWRDLYLYGFIDQLGRGVDYPFLNNSHYPFETLIFKLIPEGSNSNNLISGINIPIKPIEDGCE